MKIRDQIMLCLGFGMNDTTFDEYAEEFGIRFSEEKIKDIISTVRNFPIQTILLDFLFVKIISDCLKDFEIPCPPDPNKSDVIFKKYGFSYEANGVASYLEYRGTRYTSKKKLYTAFENDLKETFLKAIDGREIYHVDEDGLHVDGYFTKSDSGTQDNPEKTWRHCIYSFCYPDIETLKTDKKSAVDEAETNAKMYEQELTPDEVIRTFACYYKGTMPEAAPMTADLSAYNTNKGYIDIPELPHLPFDCIPDTADTEPTVF